jgi:peptidoglycan/LPS O-acetylase OafA/YrhL
VGALAFRLAIRGGLAPELGAYTLMPARADALAAGAWIAVALRTGVDLGVLQRHARWLLPVTGAAAFTLFVWQRSFWELDPVVQTVGYTCLALGFAAALCLCLDAPGRETLFGTAFRVPVLRSLGKYSYAMYCFNPLVLKALKRGGITAHSFPEVGGSVVPSLAVYGTIFFGLTFAVSLLSWHLYEKHFLSLKDRFAGSGTRGVPASAPAVPVVGGAALVETTAGTGLAGGVDRATG